MGEEEGYRLTMAFLDQTPSFAHGFECGKIWQRMKDSAKVPIEAVVPNEVRAQVEAMAMAAGWTEAFRDAGPDHVEVTLYPPLRDGAAG